MLNSNPYNAEEAIITCALIDNDCLDDIPEITPSHFSKERNRLVYNAILKMREEKQKYDLVILSNYIQTKTKNDSFVEIANIFSLNTGTPANIKHYAEAVKSNYRDRSLTTLFQRSLGDLRGKSFRLDEFQKSLNEIADNGTSEVTIAKEILSNVLETLESPEKMPVVSSGYADLDKIVHGFHPSDLIIVAARPSMGKTLIALNMAQRIVVNQKKSVLIFSLEMSKQDLMKRMISNLARINHDKIRASKLANDETLRISEITPLVSEARLFIDDRSYISVADIRSICRKVRRDSGLDLIIIDYIGLMKSEGENETHRISTISRDLKILAKDFNVPVIALSQLNRNLENRDNKRPMLADLRQSGSLEQDADLVLALFREEVYDELTPNKGLAELHVLKQRNGPLGKIALNFKGEFCSFEETNLIPIITTKAPKKNYKNFNDYSAEQNML